MQIFIKGLLYLFICGDAPVPLSTCEGQKTMPEIALSFYCGAAEIKHLYPLSQLAGAQ